MGVFHPCFLLQSVLLEKDWQNESAHGAPHIPQLPTLTGNKEILQTRKLESQLAATTANNEGFELANPQKHVGFMPSSRQTRILLAW